MGLPTVNKFLCCCPLETGGIIVGAFNVFFGLIGVLGGITFALLGSTMIMFPQNIETFWWGVGVLISASILILFYLLYFVAGILLISAVKRRDHERMRLIMFLMLVGVIVSFISIIGSLWGGLAGAILYSIFTCYFYICIYSLHVKFKTENQSGTVTFEPTPYA